MTGNLFIALVAGSMGVIGGLLGAWLTNHYTTRASRITQRHDLYREVLFTSEKIHLLAGVVNDMPGWRFWLPGSGMWREYILRLLSEAIEPGFRTAAELALKDDPSYEQILDLLGQLTTIQQEATSHMLSWTRDPTMVDRMQLIIGELRDVMKEDLAKMERARW